MFDRIRQASTAVRSLAVVVGLMACLAVGARQAEAAPAFPFGSHIEPYAEGTLKPTFLQATLDGQTAAFYAKWKAAYLKPGCKSGHYYVKADTHFGATVVSEGQGYGMLIVAMMAGRDPNAQKLFDGLLAYALDHPSGIEPTLMSWAQNARCQNIESNDSATDGDLDIAYALLLAHKQWGSAGRYDYRTLAAAVIGGLYRANVTPQTKLMNLGDWVTTIAPSSKFKYGTRSSDWMPGHFRAFAKVQSAWTGVLNTHLALIIKMQNTYSPNVWLLPDFIVDTNTTAKPAPSGYLEGATDGQYSYNACRDPWRIGVDAAISGDSRARSGARRISAWARIATAGKPERLRDGYRLNGSATVDYNTMSFVAPFTVAAMSDPNGQAWLDALWAMMVAAAPQGYYPDSIKLLSMLAVSRNWLTP